MAWYQLLYTYHRGSRVRCLPLKSEPLKGYECKNDARKQGETQIEVALITGMNRMKPIYGGEKVKVEHRTEKRVVEGEQQQWG